MAEKTTKNPVISRSLNVFKKVKGCKMSKHLSQQLSKFQILVTDSSLWLRIWMPTGTFKIKIKSMQRGKKGSKTNFNLILEGIIELLGRQQQPRMEKKSFFAQ